MGVEDEAKQIMNTFFETLSKANLPEVDIGVEREASTREPVSEACDDEFVTQMLKNAPEVKDNCIVAEKKSW